MSTFKLLSNKSKPVDTTDYESNAIYNAGKYASSETALKIKHRIAELYRGNNDARATLNAILREIDEEWKAHLKE